MSVLRLVVHLGFNDIVDDRSVGDDDLLKDESWHGSFAVFHSFSVGAVR
jgi:hypothetical protein